MYRSVPELVGRVVPFGNLAYIQLSQFYLGYIPDIKCVTSHTFFWCATLINWEWPGDKGMLECFLDV